MPTLSFVPDHSFKESGPSDGVPNPNLPSPKDNTQGLAAASSTAASAAHGKFNQPRLLLMGMRRSGKTSITSVVFQKLPASETLFIESTLSTKKFSMRSNLGFEIWDFPGKANSTDPIFDYEVFRNLGTLVWVIDAQADYYFSVTTLHTLIIQLHRRHPAINIEVFIHKVDGLSEEYRGDILEGIKDRTQIELDENMIKNVEIRYHLTSVYDSSIFEALSKVVQKLVAPLSTIENMLDLLCTTTGIQKVFLFDAMSKLYIATDSSPTDTQVFELCSDYIDMVFDISKLYNHESVLATGPTDELPAPLEKPEASSMVTLANGMAVYLKEINRYLLLVCLMRREDREKMGIIDYNIQVFQKGVLEVLNVNNQPF